MKASNLRILALSALLMLLAGCGTTKVVDTWESDVIEPEPALVDAYGEGYRRYRALYPAIKESLS